MSEWQAQPFKSHHGYRFCILWQQWNWEYII